MANNDTLTRLDEVLAARQSASPEESYTAKLFDQGLDKILEKVGEEATETLIAAKNGQTQAIVAETADLWFHSLVMLKHFGLSAQDVLDELEGRFGLSGLEEKASRQE